MHYVQPSCHSRKPSALTKRLWPTGLSLQAEKSLPHYSTFHCVWADSGWVQRYIDTLRHLGRPGTPSSPPYRRPLELRTSTLCSPPHPSYEANSTNYKSCYQNKWTPLSLLLKSLGAALRTNGSQKTLVNTIQQTAHQQLLSSLSTNNIQRAILISQTAKNTGAHSTTAQQRSLRGTRQVLPSFACQTTHATPPSR